MTDPATMPAEQIQHLREELMRCGMWAVSERLDGSIGKRSADRIREIAHRACWPEEYVEEPGPDVR